MIIKAIVLDMDGTLLTSEKEISQKTKESLIKAQEKGIKVILASGRPTSGMLKHAEQLMMDKYDGYLVSYNGAMVTECKTNTIIFNQAIDVQTCKDILDHLKNFKVIPMINNSDTMFVNDVFNNNIHLESNDINIIEYESRGGNFELSEKRDLSAFLDFPLNKILVAGQPDYLQENHKAIYSPFETAVTGAFSAPVYFEFTDKDIDKAKALDTIFPSLGILSENMISFGDGHNDRSIVEYAGIGVAMGNAVPELKEIADIVTLSNDEDGISKVLETYI